MSHDDDGDLLAPVDLHAWRVPQPSAADHDAILARVLSPAAPPGRSRVTWMLAALVIGNVVLAAIVLIVISRPSPQTVTMLQPAGGGDVDAQMQEVLRRLEREQRELEGKLADVQQLHTVVEQLSERVGQCERLDRSAKPDSKSHRAAPPTSDRPTCDDASCAPAQAPSTSPNTRTLPDTLDRDAISAAIGSVRQQVQACGQRSAAKGNVKVRVRVNPAGRAETVQVESTPDPALGACVASVVQSAIFEPTYHGGAFSYPFVFGASL